jgi:uncharacterized membrane protein YeaQ/YmgE (transglycosylase-associated protein family)
MTILTMIIVGLVAGAIARLVVPGRDPMGILGTILLGLVGSILGGWVALAFGDGNGVGIIGDVIGSVVVLLVYRAITGRNRRHVA